LNFNNGLANGNTTWGTDFKAGLFAKKPNSGARCKTSPRDQNPIWKQPPNKWGNCQGNLPEPVGMNLYQRFAQVAIFPTNQNCIEEETPIITDKICPIRSKQMLLRIRDLTCTHQYLHLDINNLKKSSKENLLGVWTQQILALPQWRAQNSITIGRHEENHVQLQNGSVSMKHASINCTHRLVNKNEELGLKLLAQKLSGRNSKIIDRVLGFLEGTTYTATDHGSLNGTWKILRVGQPERLYTGQTLTLG
jgi:hypothetical protein